MGPTCFKPYSACPRPDQGEGRRERMHTTLLYMVYLLIDIEILDKRKKPTWYHHGVEWVQIEWHKSRSLSLRLEILPSNIKK